jgi:hypothetical protein
MFMYNYIDILSFLVNPSVASACIVCPAPGGLKQKGIQPSIRLDRLCVDRDPADY